MTGVRRIVIAAAAMSVELCAHLVPRIRGRSRLSKISVDEDVREREEQRSDCEVDGRGVIAPRH
jgi:hypothetical protein